MTNTLRTLEEHPVLATRSPVLLPGVETSLEVGRTASMKAVEAADRDDKLILVLPQKDPMVLAPKPLDLHSVGVLAEIRQLEKSGPRTYTVTLRTRGRVTVDSYVSTRPYLIARVRPMVAVNATGPHIEDLLTELKPLLAAVIGARALDQAGRRDESSGTLVLESDPEEIMVIDDAEQLLAIAASQIELGRDDQIKLLTEEDTAERLRIVLPIISRLNRVLTVKASIDAQLTDDVAKTARERVLRERMRAIKEELGENESELDELRVRIDEASMPDEVRQAAMRQFRRMSQMSTSSPEYNVSRTYVETLLDIPWGTTTEDVLDVAAARDLLEAEHASLDKVKKRILEFIAVRKLAPDKQGPILCLVGPPGVGKTSLGRSIAEALQRKYVRISLGGVRDESEIRGHRRTYIGALPGRIANGLKKAGSMNPVFVLDEIDKLGSDVRGDPSSAMLEVLDPEQNHAFSDHYLEVDLDLSRVMFLATANQLDTIPPPLLDRMEVIRIPGYTIEEKRVIAKQHLWPKQVAEHGLADEEIILDEDALDFVITHYTREAGVRNLERELAALCRHAAVEIAGGQAGAFHVTHESLAATLGPPRFFSETADRHPEVGICTGLSWTPTGGDIMFIEARAMPGKGELKLTGQLGDIMSESAAAAFSWVRANAERLEIDAGKLPGIDIHMHIPSGAVRKDGPSAGVAISTALVSLLSARPVRNDVAVTGEITLRGLSLPVNGIKEKVLAAHRAGIKIVLLPERNRKDLEDIPEEVRSQLDIRFVKRVDDALEIALGGGLPPVASMPPSSAAAEHPAMA